MDAKITKKRLAHMLSYDWIKILLCIAAAIVVWSLILTMTATKITSTQRFVVYNYSGVRLGTGLKIYDGYSYEILEAEFVDQLRGGEEMFSQIYDGNVQTGEGDVMMVANVPTERTIKKDENGTELKDEAGNPIYEYGITYIEKALRNYSGSYTRFDDDGTKIGFFSQMKNYLSLFYTATSETEKTFGEMTVTVASFDENSLNEQAAKTAFRERIKKNKDKRFKKESQIVEGEKLELERLRSYLTAYNTFIGHLEAGRILPVYASAQITEEYQVSGYYALNLCPDETKMPKLKDQFYYTDFDGTEKAENLCAMFMNLEGLDKNFQYENLIYINALMQAVYTEA